jgi:uncharacterized RDD family membrane protein YckC
MGAPPSSRVTPGEAPKGGFGVRFLAYLIDQVALTVVDFVLAIFLHNAQTVYYLIALICSVSYFVYFWSGSRGQTLGMRVLHLKVIKTDGSQLTLSNAFLRYIGYIISSFCLCLGFLWILFDANKQGWHDKIAGTYIVTRWAEQPAAGQIAA